MAASVLSGNRNFEARVHQNIKANFLMSPPLVVAFALAGRVDIDLSKEPIGKDGTASESTCAISGRRLQEMRDTMRSALTPEVFRRLYRDFASRIRSGTRSRRARARSTSGTRRVDLHPRAAVLQNFRMEPGHIEDIRDARPLGIFGDSVTTDHISPAGAIKPTSPAGQYLDVARRSNRRISTATAVRAATIWS